MTNTTEQLRLAEGALTKNGFTKLDDIWVAPARQPALTVWEGAMPESNGKSNFTSLLCRKGGGIFDTDAFTIARSEYPGRVKYEADRVRYLIGELAERPCITDYDVDAHSDYVPRDHERFISFYDLRKLMATAVTGQGSYGPNYDGAKLAAALEERMEPK